MRMKCVFIKLLEQINYTSCVSRWQYRQCTITWLSIFAASHLIWQMCLPVCAFPLFCVSKTTSLECKISAFPSPFPDATLQNVLKNWQIESQLLYWWWWTLHWLNIWCTVLGKMTPYFLSYSPSWSLEVTHLRLKPLQDTRQGKT